MCIDWRKPTFDKTTDHRNNMMVAQFAFLFLVRQTTCQKFSPEMEVKTSDVIVKNNQQKCSMVCTLIDHRNDAKMVPLEF